MKVIVVANPKGGVGKSTLSTNLAGYLAQTGRVVMLGDLDRQHSSRAWAQMREAHLPPILGWDLEDGSPAKPPKGASHVVLDTPAGLHGKLLEKALKAATHVIVPLQPSVFDMLATRDFFAELMAMKAVRKGTLKVGVVGMRVDPRTRSAQELDRFLEGYDLPVLTHLRDAQVYVQLAARGLTLFDVSPASVARDLEQWAPLLEFVTHDPDSLRSAALD